MALSTDLPILPPALLRQHHVLETIDTRFRACARLLQALWRERQGLEIGRHHPRDGRPRKLGSRLSPATAAAGRNFLSPEVALLVRRELAYRERGAFIEQGRLFSNLLSSTPLAFNLFAPLALDLSFAAKALRPLFPNLDIHQVTGVRFEHSPGRGDPAITGDQSAFDVAITYTLSDGQAGFIGIEVKYSESMREAAPAELSDRLDQLAQSSGLYRHWESALLRVNPLQQLFREHLLAQAALAKGDYAESTFVLIAARHNHLAQRAATLYADQLAPPAEGRTAFIAIDLERIIEAIGWAGQADYALALHDRYTDWSQIDDAVDRALRAQNAGWSLAAPPAARVVKLIAGLR